MPNNGSQLSFENVKLIPEMTIDEIVKYLIEKIKILTEKEKVSAINKIKIDLHEISPFCNEPVDCVLWVENTNVVGNDYNPNKVAPPEMRLLEVSILEDGYTQPIVVWHHPEGYEIIDGFHRGRVGKESMQVRERIKHYLPISIVNEKSAERQNRMASTIRHNRARGKHTVEGMSDIVLELKNRNWTNERIAKQLGMDEDEILRLCQITGLASLFSGQDFSKSWDIENSEPEFIPLEDEIVVTPEDKFRTVNTNDENRIFHVYTDWECYKAGLYATTKDGMTKTQCEQAYAEFLSDSDKFSDALSHVITEWKNSCEHYLTNSEMNRIAWLGQAAMCYATGVPATFRGGFNLMPISKQNEANEVALLYLNKWLVLNNREVVTMSEALSDNQMDLY